MSKPKKKPAKKKQSFPDFMENNYRKSWDFIKSSKTFIFIIIGIFLAFMIAGFFVPVPADVSSEIMKYLKQIVDETQGLSPVGLISFIFLNNVKSSFIGLIFGIAIGIFPVFVSLFNGYILGFVARMSVNADGVLVLWRLLPHGIFELPAVFISLGMGMKLGISLLKDKDKFRNNLIDSIRVFISVVVPLLIIAAIIEGTLISVFGK